MGQITFYLDDELEQQMNHFIQQQNQPTHLWLADAIQRKLNNGWSADVINLAGSWDDFPIREQIGVEMALDVPRESL